MILLSFNITNNEKKFKNNFSIDDEKILEITVDNTEAILRILENHNILVSFFINDVSCTIFIRPFHKHIVPNNFNIKSTVCAQDVNIELLNSSIFPFRIAYINDIIKKAGQILFNISLYLFKFIFSFVFYILVFLL